MIRTVDGVRTFTTQKERDKLLSLVHGRYLEIGVFEGYTMEAALSKAEYAIGIDTKRNSFIDNLENLYPQFQFIQGASERMHSKIQDDSVDVLFIDGYHPQVVLDFVLYYPKVKTGGTVIFHDNNKSCFPAVSALIIGLNYCMNIYKHQSLAWFYKGEKKK